MDADQGESQAKSDRTAAATGDVPDGSRSDLTPLPVGVLCPDCGYDLRWLTSERCPECGFALEGLRARQSEIPWSHRRELGAFRAYWKTVWLVGRRPKRFCLEMARPVSYRDSQSFRWVTALHAYLPILIVSITWCIFDWGRGWTSGAELWWVLGGLQVVALLLLAGLPGLASYLFQSRRLSVEQQNRAIALSYYTGASLACTPLALLAYTAALATWKPWGNTHVVLLLVAAGIWLGTIALWEPRLYVFLKHILHGSRFSRALRMMALDALAFGLGLLAVLVPLSVFYIAVIFSTLG